MGDIDIDCYFKGIKKNINLTKFKAFTFNFKTQHLSFTTSFINFFARTENCIIKSYTNAGTILNCERVNSMH